MSRVTVICNDSEYFLRHRRSVADALAERGHSVTVITGGPGVAPTASVKWRYVHIPIERFAFRFGPDTALAIRTVREILVTRPEALHLITLKPAVVSGLAALLARLPARRPKRILITVPGLGRLMSPDSALGGIRAKTARLLAERSIRLLSSRPGVFFTFETRHDRNHWLQKRLIREDNSAVIAGAGVEPEKFFPGGRTGDGKFRILFASRLLKSKGLDTFLEAARAFSDTSEVEFLVAGMIEPHDPDGLAPDELRRERAIRFLGEIADMPELLRNVDLVCLPTRYGEGIPRILIEAAASGVACITSDLNGCREIVEDGITGMLLPIDAAQAMAASLQRAIRIYLRDRDLSRTHGEAGYRKFLAGDYSQESVVKHFVEILTGSLRRD